MEVELRFFAMVREAVGERTLAREFEAGTTVLEVLEWLESAYPGLEGTLVEAGDVAPSVTVLRNGTNVTHHADGATELADGDRISITPPVTGG